MPLPDKLWRPGGCRSCGQTGFRGRLAITEVMPVSEDIERRAVSHAPSGDIGRAAVAAGMVPLRVDGLHKAAGGLTTVEEVIRVTV